MTRPRLDMREIVRRFPGGAGVLGVSFAVAPGEVVCLLGPSGCGKSTTLRIAAGVERADSGMVSVDGEMLQGPRCWVPPERRQVGLMFQDYALFPHLTVFRNVMFGLDGMAAAKDVAARVLAQVGLSHLANVYPSELSGGEQQRVALARAMAPEPKMMLMDEPFSGLDARLRDDVRDSTMRILAAAGASALVVTHDPEEAMTIANRIVLMRSGRIVQDATPDAMYTRPADIQAAAFFSEHTVLRSAAQNGRAATPIGPAPAAFADGTPVEILVRPDALILATGGTAAKVTSLRRVGSDHVAGLTVQWDSGSLELRARWRLDSPPKVGDMVNVALHPGRTLAFKQT